MKLNLCNVAMRRYKVVVAVASLTTDGVFET